MNRRLTGSRGLLAGAGVIALFGGGCGPAADTIKVEDFSGERAYAHVEQLVAFGPRPSGSGELAQAATYLAEQLRAAGLAVEEQTFRAGTPRGPMEFRNVIGRTRRSSRGKIVVIGSHYDTKWLADIRFVGANDGGSSSGVLLELARVAGRERDLWFVFFDGEEAMQEYGRQDGLWGSKFFVESLKGEGLAGAVEAMILLDMVGDRDLRVTIPGNCTGWLVQRAFDAAAALGHRDRFAFGRQSLVDDHVPFLAAGIPAVNLVDFEFGSGPGRHDYWHTEEDSLDKISARSLELTGRVTLELIKQMRR